MGTQLLLPQRGAAPSPIFGPHLLRPNGCNDQDATWYGARPQPMRLRVRWGPSLPPKFSAQVWGMFIIVIVSCRTPVKRLCACAQIHYLCFSNYRIWVKYSGNLVTLLTLFVLKKDCSMFKVTVTVTVVTSFKNIVAYRRSALNPV